MCESVWQDDGRGGVGVGGGDARKSTLWIKQENLSMSVKMKESHQQGCSYSDIVSEMLPIPIEILASVSASACTHVPIRYHFLKQYIVMQASFA